MSLNEEGFERIRPYVEKNRKRLGDTAVLSYEDRPVTPAPSGILTLDQLTELVHGFAENIPNIDGADISLKYGTPIHRKDSFPYVQGRRRSDFSERGVTYSADSKEVWVNPLRMTEELIPNTISVIARGGAWHPGTVDATEDTVWRTGVSREAQEKILRGYGGQWKDHIDSLIGSELRGAYQMLMDDTNPGSVSFSHTGRSKYKNISTAAFKLLQQDGISFIGMMATGKNYHKNESSPLYIKSVNGPLQ